MRSSRFGAAALSSRPSKPLSCHAETHHKEGSLLITDQPARKYSIRSGEKSRSSSMMTSASSAVSSSNAKLSARLYAAAIRAPRLSVCPATSSSDGNCTRRKACCRTSVATCSSSPSCTMNTFAASIPRTALSDASVTDSRSGRACASMSRGKASVRSSVTISELTSSTVLPLGVDDAGYTKLRYRRADRLPAAKSGDDGSGADICDGARGCGAVDVCTVADLTSR